MAATFDFRCERGHVFEESVERSTFSLDCYCGRRAHRELSVPRLPGVARGVPAPTPRDQRPLRIGAMQEAAAEVNHQWERAGVPASQRPDYFEIGKAKAHAALAGKIAPPHGWTDPIKAG